MKNVHLIPTDKPSRLYTNHGQLHLDSIVQKSNGHTIDQHIYITSSEEIKDRNCWVTNGKDVFKPLDDYSLEYANSYWQKIILTTDQDLINVEAIQDEFLEWFVKNPSCEQVEVVKEMYMPQSNGKISDGKITHELSLNESLNTLPFYRIIIPKEEPKQENCCTPVGQIKRYVDCKGCDRKPKQEPTLEEAAEKYVEDFDLSFYNTVEEIPVKELGKKDFKEGAKWQSERMYSEEEVIAFTQWMYDYKGDINKVEELLKQFKNEQ
jgi:hypothetical protein